VHLPWDNTGVSRLRQHRMVISMHRVPLARDSTALKFPGINASRPRQHCWRKTPRVHVITDAFSCSRTSKRRHGFMGLTSVVAALPHCTEWVHTPSLRQGKEMLVLCLGAIFTQSQPSHRLPIYNGLGFDLSTSLALRKSLINGPGQRTEPV
jgi:hypothetical protein